MNTVRPLVFFPPFLLCAAVVALNLADPAAFKAVMTQSHQWVASSFGWLVSLLSLVMLGLCAAIGFSPFGRTVLGGPTAQPLLTRWQLFAVVLTTNIAAGILFWCVFEPLSYLQNPPLGIVKNSPAAAQFAIATVYLHWTVTPYAIASIVGLMFAFAYYNMAAPFSLSAPLVPLVGRQGAAAVAPVIDAVCLYALIAGLAAALAGGSLILAGGIHHVCGIDGPPTPLLLGLIIAAIMITSVAAAISGVTKGISFIATVNTVFLIGFLALILFLGPTRFILDFAVEGFGLFLGSYFPRVLFTGAAHGEQWPHDWTQMLFSAFFAWAPIMGVFLGRIAYGYSVRAFLAFNGRAGCAAGPRRSNAGFIWLSGTAAADRSARAHSFGHSFSVVCDHGRRDHRRHEQHQFAGHLSATLRIEQGGEDRLGIVDRPLLLGHDWPRGHPHAFQPRWLSGAVFVPGNRCQCDSRACQSGSLRSADGSALPCPF